jgi:hypothetical protein
MGSNMHCGGYTGISHSAGHYRYDRLLIVIEGRNIQGKQIHAK